MEETLIELLQMINLSITTPIINALNGVNFLNEIFNFLRSILFYIGKIINNDMTIDLINEFFSNQTIIQAIAQSIGVATLIVVMILIIKIFELVIKLIVELMNDFTIELNGTPNREWRSTWKRRKK